MKAIFGRDTIRTQCADLLYDESRYTEGIPAAVFFPENQQEVLNVIGEAASCKAHLTVIGGQTGITGGSVPADETFAICFSSMKRILKATKSSDGKAFLTCQPGVTIETIAKFLSDTNSWPTSVAGDKLESKAWFYPPDPTEISAQLGGTVATNASGSRSFRFGPTRNYIESVKIALPNGDTAHICRGCGKFENGFYNLKTNSGKILNIPEPLYRSIALKNAAGYYFADNMDIIDLFIGSEGTLAIFTEIEIRLLPVIDILAGLSFFPSREKAFDFADKIRPSKDFISIEYFDSTALEIISSHSDDISLKLPAIPSGAMAAVYWEINSAAFEKLSDFLEKSLADCGSSLENTWSGTDDSEKERLKQFRHAVPELVNRQIAFYQRSCPSIRKIGTDAAVPEKEFRKFFDAAAAIIYKNEISFVVFGHLGDCHLHFNLLPANQHEFQLALSVYSDIQDLAISYKGTISAEHGIGKLKIPYLEKMYGLQTIEEMKAIKKVLDPEWTLNRGTLFRYPHIKTVTES
jgi:D-lactate dehydrogenase (cytochrome)